MNLEFNKYFDEFVYERQSHYLLLISK